LYLPAGTVHAIGGGAVFAEIQQTSDATFRLFDWNRRDSQGKPRPMHIEEGLAAVHWDQGPLAPLAIEDFTLDASRQGVPLRRELVRCPYFHLDFVRETEVFSLTEDNRMQALMVFAGQARLDSGQQLLPGQVWLFPAAMTERSCQPQPVVTGMLCTLP
jgi:mannose-6-phosphate isomerase